jgi:hypothetical protein
MKSKTKKILAPMVIGATLLQLTACGGGGGKTSGSGGTSVLPRQFEADAEGMYVASLSALNNGVGGPISGNVSVNKEGARIIAYVRLNGGHAHIAHQQRVHVGTSCPTKEDDKNGDGYVDVNEAFSAVGKILFPLDADISSQERGSSIWPAGDMYGYYHWERATSFERFISDLREPDLNEENDFAKLGPNGPLNLDGRVVLILGADQTLANLPDTVGTRGRLANFQVMPVACGVIRKVSSVPGAIEDDPSLGPASGESVGGSSGVDDGATIPVDGEYRPGETTGGEAGGTNDADHDPRPGGTSGGSSDDDDDDDGGFHWPWERHPRTTTGGSGGGTTGGSTSGGSTSGGSTSGGSTSGGSTSGDVTTGGTSGGTTGGTTGAETTGGTYGDDDE